MAGMQPGAIEPVHDQEIFTHVIFSQLEGRFNGANSQFRWEGEVRFARDSPLEGMIRSLGSFGLSKNTRFSAIFGEETKGVLSQVLSQKEGTKTPAVRSFAG
jgi:hypothetical protein